MIALMISIIALIVAIACYLANHCFDNDDPDQFWYDNFPEPTPKELQKKCKHPEVYLKVLSEIVNCEKTVVACRYCGKHLSKPTTDCR